MNEPELSWPPLILQEYRSFDLEKKCLNAERLNTHYQLQGNLRFIPEALPCFLVGRINNAEFILLGLNPALQKRRLEVESKIYCKKGWEKASLTFFDWFSEEGLFSQYYHRFAVFLKGFLSEEKPDKWSRWDRVSRLKMLGERLVNIDLIPYHSKGYSLTLIERLKSEPLEGYIENARALIDMNMARVVFVNGRTFKPLLERLGFKEEESLSITVNENRGSVLKVRIGEYEGRDGRHRKAVWFEQFLTGRIAATNQGLYEAGCLIREALE